MMDASSTESTVFFDVTKSLVRVLCAAVTCLEEIMLDPLPDCSAERRVVEAWKAMAWQRRGVPAFITLLSNCNSTIETDVAYLCHLQSPSTGADGVSQKAWSTGVAIPADCVAAVQEALSTMSYIERGCITPSFNFYTNALEIVGILCSSLERVTRQAADMRVAPSGFLARAVDAHMSSSEAGSMSNPDSALAPVFSDTGFEYMRRSLSPEARQLCADFDRAFPVNDFAPGVGVHHPDRAEMIKKRNAAIRARFGDTIAGVAVPGSEARERADELARRGSSSSGGPSALPAGLPTSAEAGADIRLFETGPRFDMMVTLHGAYPLFLLISRMLIAAQAVGAATGHRKPLPAPIAAWEDATAWDIYTWCAHNSRRWLRKSMLRSSEYVEVVTAVARRLGALCVQMMTPDQVSSNSDRRFLMVTFGVLEPCHPNKDDGAEDGADDGACGFMFTNAAIQGLGMVIIECLRIVLGTHLLLHWYNAMPPHGSRRDPDMRAREALHAIVHTCANQSKAGSLRTSATIHGYHGVMWPGVIDRYSQRYDTKFSPIYRPPPYPRTICHKVLGFSDRVSAMDMETVQVVAPATCLAASEIAYPETAALVPTVFNVALDTTSTVRWNVSPITCPSFGDVIPEANETKPMEVYFDPSTGSTVPVSNTVQAFRRNPTFAVMYPIYLFFSDLETRCKIDCSICAYSHMELLGCYCSRTGPFSMYRSTPIRRPPPLIVTIGGPVVVVIHGGSTRLVTACSYTALYVWCSIVLHEMGGILLNVLGKPVNISRHLKETCQLDPPVLRVGSVPRDRFSLTHILQESATYAAESVLPIFFRDKLSRDPRFQVVRRDARGRVPQGSASAARQGARRYDDNCDDDGEPAAAGAGAPLRLQTLAKKVGNSAMTLIRSDERLSLAYGSANPSTATAAATATATRGRASASATSRQQEAEMQQALDMRLHYTIRSATDFMSQNAVLPDPHITNVVKLPPRDSRTELKRARDAHEQAFREREARMRRRAQEPEPDDAQDAQRYRRALIEYEID